MRTLQSELEDELVRVKAILANLTNDFGAFQRKALIRNTLRDGERALDTLLADDMKLACATLKEIKA